jgi:AcrR family transcriptional regulator
MPEERRPSSFSPKMKRTFQSATKKHLIRKLANEVFAEKGYGETTISRIAKKANISKGNIYGYFRNKEKLLFSIPKERMEIFLYAQIGSQSENEMDV